MNFSLYCTTRVLFLLGICFILFPSTGNALTRISSNNLGITNGLVGYWTFDGKYLTNATATDISGQGNDGVLVNSPRPVIGKVGQGLNFFPNNTDTNAYVSIGNPSVLNFGSGDFSIAFWMKGKGYMAQGSSVNIVLGKIDLDNGSSAQGYGFGYSSSNQMIFIIANGTTQYSAIQSVATVSDNRWHQYVGARSGGISYLYVDGLLVATSTVSGSVTRSNDLNIGADSNTTYRNPNAYIDDLRIYNRTLSSTEIRKLFGTNQVALRTNHTATTTVKIASSFTCGVSTVADADGNSYNTLQIGSQCWMKQNMRVGTRVNIASGQANNGTIEKYCYSDTAANCTSNDPNQPDGGLYEWNEAMQYVTTPGARGICPAGWHIPTHDEFTTMERAVCTSGSCATDFPYDTSTTGYRGTNEGTKLKPSGTSGWEGNLAGYSLGDSFLSRGTFGIFWSSSESGGNAWLRYLSSGSAQVGRNAIVESYGLSVRCLKG